MQRIRERLKSADRIVCVSKTTRCDLLDIADFDASRIVTIPNAVFQPMAPASSEDCAALRFELGLPNDATLVLHVGRHFYKNREAVLDVFARIHAARADACLVLIGALTPKLGRPSVARLGLESQVRAVGHIAADKMAALYTTSSLLLFPSLYEGFGYPVLEAQLCGTPVICSGRGSLAEVAGEGARVFPPDDIEGMAAAALELLDDSKARTTLSSRGHEKYSAIHAGKVVRRAFGALQGIGLIVICAASFCAMLARAGPVVRKIGQGGDIAGVRLWHRRCRAGTRAFHSLLLLHNR